MSQQFEIIEKILCYDGFFKLARYKLKHTLFAGGWSGELIRELLERGQAAAILPYDPIRDEVVFIEQFRPGAIHSQQGAWLWEIVAGIIEEGETPAEVVVREAQEEAGCVVTDLIHICDFFVSPGSTSETTALFCGKVDATTATGIHGVVSESEDIQVHVLPFAEAVDRLNSGKLIYAPAIIALQWLLLNKSKVKRQWRVRKKRASSV